MTNKLVVIINSLKVPKIKKILLYEISCTKLQLPPESLTRGGYRPKIPILPVLCPQLILLNPPPSTKKILGTPLARPHKNVTGSLKCYAFIVRKGTYCGKVRTFTCYCNRLVGETLCSSRKLSLTS